MFLGFRGHCSSEIRIPEWEFRSIVEPMRRPLISLVGLFLVLVFCSTFAGTGTTVSRSEFAQYIDQWSEPEGYFDTDNFISNETSYLHVIEQLHQRVKPGGIYLGVGPDQNFSYIAHTRPMFAVVTDIRRQNMLELLWYKALFSIAANRVE